MSTQPPPLMVEAIQFANTVALSKGRVCVAVKVKEVGRTALPAWHVFAKFHGAQKGVNVGAIVSPSRRVNPDPWRAFGAAQAWVPA